MVEFKRLINVEYSFKDDGEEDHEHVDDVTLYFIKSNDSEGKVLGLDKWRERIEDAESQS